MRNERILQKATFDPKLPTYWLLTTILVLAVTIVGIPLIPIWLLLGPGIHRRQLERMHCELTERSINIRRGNLFRVEKNVPLDKIQDVSMREGPVLRYLGLSALAIETAGQSGGAQGGSDALLVGVVDAPKFRDAILEQRDRVVGAADIPSARPASDGGDPVLVEILGSLRRIEGLLARETPRG